MNEYFKQALKFLGFSVTAGLIQILSFTLMNELLTISYWPAYLTSLVLSVLYNYILNRKFTFKSSNNVPFSMFLVFLYYLVFTPLSTLWGEALTKQAGWNEYLVLALTMVINFVTEFLYQRYVVFRKQKVTNDINQDNNIIENEIVEDTDLQKLPDAE